MSKRLSDQQLESLFQSDAELSEMQENLSDSEEFVVSSESDIFADDSDADPHYNPNEASTSTSRQHLPFRPLDLSSSSSDDENLASNFSRPNSSVRGRGVRGRGRGRPRRTSPIPGADLDISESENEDDPSNIKWQEVREDQDPETPHSFSYNELPGPKHCPPSDAKPIAYFRLFFSLAMLNDIVKETNRYAQQYIDEQGPNLSVTNKVKNWKNVTVTEITAFIAVLLNMGLVNKPTLKSYWSTDALGGQVTSWFGKMFSRARFECIYMFFHLTDNSKLAKTNDPNYDPTSKFQPALKHANQVFRHYYTPNKQISIDKSLVGTKNYSRMLQYLPNKHHHKWGIKLWMVCDSVTSYCLGFMAYKGAAANEDKEEIQKHGLGYFVVMKLLQICNFLNKGFHVFVDNFFTSFQLIRDLYEKQTLLTGTFRRNRKYLPTDVKKKFTVGEKKYFRHNYMLTLAYREKASQVKPVILVSSDAQAKNVETRRMKFGQEIIKNKPMIIDHYNKFMGGIDTSDMMLYAYLDERRSTKYWKKVVFNIYGRMILNAYILYKLNCTGKPMSRYCFMVSIIRDITIEWLQSKGGLVAADGGGGDAPRVNMSPQQPGLTKLPGRKEKCCVVCSKISLQQGGKMKRSRTACIKCGKGLHGLCLTQHTC